MGEIDPAKIPVVILAGGKGARFDHESQVLPKPMIEVAGRPILVHIIESLADQGFREFYIATGYLGDRVYDGLLEPFEGHVIRTSETTVVDNPPFVACVDTGRDSHTGERLWKMRHHIAGRRFVLTYGDGLSDVQMADVIRAHEQELFGFDVDDVQVTLTAVNPSGRFGVLDVHGPYVTGFLEKPKNEWINGGFMVCEPEVFETMLPGCPVAGEPEIIELEGVLLPELARHEGLRAHRHIGYWQCMDNRRDRDQIELDVKLAGGIPPWRRGRME